MKAVLFSLSPIVDEGRIDYRQDVFFDLPR